MSVHQSRVGLCLGGLTIDPPLVLAPMAGLTDLAFRRLRREHGAGLAVTEMVSARGLVLAANRKSQALLSTCPEDTPLLAQIFGSQADIMAEAAAFVADRGVLGVDINMGCPVRKVVSTGAGAALMADPARAAAIVRAVRRVLSLPLTVKIRRCYSKETMQAPEFARLLEGEGADLITVHPRTWGQGLSGQADWSVVEAVKAAVKVPVVGNGDVGSYDHAKELMARTGCDGVMIGRAALGRPFVFGSEPEGPKSRAQAAQRHMELAREGLTPESRYRTLVILRKHMAWYIHALPNAGEARALIHQQTSLDDLSRLVESYQRSELGFLPADSLDRARSMAPGS